ncbi:4255_t:CDS:2, partial [Ambispora gerdemannii]
MSNTQSKIDSVKELEQKNKELETRLAVVKQSSVTVDGQPQNDSWSEDASASNEAIPEVVSAVIVPNSQMEPSRKISFHIKVNNSPKAK